MGTLADVGFHSGGSFVKSRRVSSALSALLRIKDSGLVTTLPLLNFVISSALRHDLHTKLTLIKLLTSMPVTFTIYPCLAQAIMHQVFWQHGTLMKFMVSEAQA